MTPSDGNDEPKPVVESRPGVADLTTRALQQRIRQQEILAELGVVALQGRPFLGLLNETVRLTAEGMNQNSARFWNTFQPIIAFWCGQVSVGMRALWERRR
jgi:hypothetical protein